MTGFLSLLATLIVVIPTQKGVVVAADTAVAVDGVVSKHPDVSKLVTVAPENRTIVAVTGCPMFFSDDAKPRILRNGRDRIQPEFSIVDAVAEEIRKRGDPFLSEPMMQGLSAAVVGQLAGFLSSHPKTAAGLFGTTICDVVVIQHDARNEQSLVGDFMVRSTRDGHIVADPAQIDVINQSAAKYAAFFGQGEYVSRHVMGFGVSKADGSRFMPLEMAAWWNTPKVNSDMTEGNAVRIACAIIRATERTLRFQGDTERHVGGSPRLLFIDGKSAARPIEPTFEAAVPD